MTSLTGSSSCAVASGRGFNSSRLGVPRDSQSSSLHSSHLPHPLLSPLSLSSITFLNVNQTSLRAHLSNFRHPRVSLSGRVTPLVQAKKKADEVSSAKKLSGKKSKETNGHATDSAVAVAPMKVDEFSVKKPSGKKGKDTNGHATESAVSITPPPSDGNGDLPTFEVPNFTGVEARGHYPDNSASARSKTSSKDFDYDKEMDRLQLELVKLQEWIRKTGLKVVVLFEGRDAAGKGGMIKTITAPLNPRVCYVRALGTPSDRERTQWYFQRYVAQLPAAGEMVIFDRSWYNRAGVEKVMGFCSNDAYIEFLRSCPEFERMLVRSGIILLKYWISVSPEEQEKRFKERLHHPEKRWKLSTMDLYSRSRWSDYSYAKDIMFSYTDIKQAPWYVIPADDKKAARLNCISHLLSQIPYENLIPPANMEIPPLQEDKYVRPPMSDQTFVPLIY